MMSYLYIKPSSSARRIRQVYIYRLQAQNNQNTQQLKLSSGKVEENHRRIGATEGEVYIRSGRKELGLEGASRCYIWDGDWVITHVPRDKPYGRHKPCVEIPHNVMIANFGMRKRSNRVLRATLPSLNSQAIFLVSFLEEVRTLERVLIMQSISRDVVCLKEL
jgi:hypothetical protein